MLKKLCSRWSHPSETQIKKYWRRYETESQGRGSRVRKCKETSEATIKLKFDPDEFVLNYYVSLLSSYFGRSFN